MKIFNTMTAISSRFSPSPHHHTIWRSAATALRSRRAANFCNILCANRRCFSLSSATRSSAGSAPSALASRLGCAGNEYYFGVACLTLNAAQMMPRPVTEGSVSLTIYCSNTSNRKAVFAFVEILFFLFSFETSAHPFFVSYLFLLGFSHLQERHNEENSVSCD